MKTNLFKELCKINNISSLIKFSIDNYKIFANRCDNITFEKLNKNKIVIFGSGVTGKRLLNSLAKNGVKVEFFCDNDKNRWGKCIDGVFVLPPEFIRNNIEDVVVLIAVSMPCSIAQQLEKIGVKYLFSDIDGTVGNKPAPCLFLNVDKLIKVDNMLIDDMSKKVFLNVLKSRIFPENVFTLGGSIFLHSVTTGLQYFDNRYFRYEDNEVYVDCGSFDGDSIVEFYKNSYELNIDEPKVYAFEPDKENYQKVIDTINRYGFKNVKVYNLGVGIGESNTTDFFNCRKNEIHRDKVSISKLDGILKDVKVTFIKMDIEGYELEALKGASQLIKNRKPKLAICIYHNTEDLYKIPLYIKSLVPEYKIFLRHHSYNSIWETVCYAYI